MPKRPKTNRPASPAGEHPLALSIREQAQNWGAVRVGLAPVERWSSHGEVPEAYRPTSIWQKARTVIVFEVPMLLPVLESTPSINYQEMYDTSNRLLDDIGYRLATWLCGRGSAAVFLPRDGYGSLEVLLDNPFGSFSHTYAAKYAGLGTVGLSRNLITPEWGPRVRFGSVLTAAVLPGDPELERDLCNGCGVCAKLCPVGAIQARSDGLVGALDKDACTRHHIELKKETRWPCGICTKVCPIGKDRALFDRRGVRVYHDERSAIANGADDPRYRGWVHLRRHGSRGDRIM